MQAIKIDANGYFLEDIPHHDGDEAADIVTTLCPGGFYRPKWDGAQWVEGEDAAVVENTLRQRTIARLAATRYEHEVRGITHGTRYLATDRTSQSKLHAARTKGLEGIAPAAGWKCADANGNIVWWDCTAAEIVSAANAAFDYVDACFKREKELDQAVADGTFTEADLETGWPS